MILLLPTKVKVETKECKKTIDHNVFIFLDAAKVI